MSNDDEVTYETGYKKPPKATQFRKGKSGNPNGRPKRAKNISTLLNKILNEKIEVREGGKVRRMSKGEAMLQSAMMKAMKGDPKALTAIISLARSSGLITDPNILDDTPKGGVLLLDQPMDEAMWQAVAEKIRKQQVEEGLY